MVRLPVYPFDVPAPGATQEVAPGVHWVRMPLPFALDHINLWLLEDGDGWTVVDTGYQSEDVKALWRTVLDGAMGGRPVHRVVATHFHPDHLGLAGWFSAEFGVPLWMTYPEWLQAHLARSQDTTHNMRALLAFYVANGFDPARGDAYLTRRTGYSEGTAPVPGTVRRIWDGEEIGIGARAWRVITGAGHSPEHAALHCPELGILISGDQVLPRITTNVSLWFTEPDGDPLRQYLDSLCKFRPLAEDTLVLPSHNRPFYGLHDRLDALVDHHEERLALAEAACGEPRTGLEVVPALFDRDLDSHQLGFAIGETLSHLNCLVTRGRLVKDVAPDGLVRYRRISRTFDPD